MPRIEGIDIGPAGQFPAGIERFLSVAAALIIG